jgi:hypothetical protein
MFHTGVHASTHCMDGVLVAALPAEHDRSMTLELTDAELATAATARRAMAFQESERAKQLENPSLRSPSEHAAQRYALPAETLEAARRSQG